MIGVLLRRAGANVPGRGLGAVFSIFGTLFPDLYITNVHSQPISGAVHRRSPCQIVPLIFPVLSFHPVNRFFTVPFIRFGSVFFQQHRFPVMENTLSSSGTPIVSSIRVRISSLPVAISWGPGSGGFAAGRPGSLESFGPDRTVSRLFGESKSHDLLLPFFIIQQHLLVFWHWGQEFIVRVCQTIVLTTVAFGHGSTLVMTHGAVVRRRGRLLVTMTGFYRWLTVSNRFMFFCLPFGRFCGIFRILVLCFFVVFVPSTIHKK